MMNHILLPRVHRSAGRAVTRGARSSLRQEPISVTRIIHFLNSLLIHRQAAPHRAPSLPYLTLTVHRLLLLLLLLSLTKQATQLGHIMTNTLATLATADCRIAALSSSEDRWSICFEAMERGAEVAEGWRAEQRTHSIRRTTTTTGDDDDDDAQWDRSIK